MSKHSPTEEEKLVEVAEWRNQKRPRQKPSRKQSQRRLLAALLFGLVCALLWHFVHLAGESYSPSLADLHFWFHLAVEGVVALYAAAIFYIIWGLIQELRKKPAS